MKIETTTKLKELYLLPTIKILKIVWDCETFRKDFYVLDINIIIDIVFIKFGITFWFNSKKKIERRK